MLKFTFFSQETVIKNVYFSQSIELTQEVGRDGTLEVDVFRTVEVVELSADKGVQVLVERFQLFKQIL